MQKELYCLPEVWGGIECTINRIGDRYSDQLALTGHYGRAADIDLLADLGIKAIRYPVLWEHHQRGRNGAIDWSWAARQLETLRRRKVTPIVGLMHHGSGPSFTHLGCPDFAAGLAGYARQVALRFPWVEYYTPVNEPLTTARFSGMYGIWYPHQRDARQCLIMLINQLKATVLAMSEIRSVNPDAKLIQTEDLAKVHSSPELAYQAEFENHRRWLTFDLLGGRVDKDHALWGYLKFIGIKEEDLIFFLRHPCVPDIMGLNYYVTSERFLDADIARYPVEAHASNGIDRYADVEAVRVIRPAGVLALLKETWERYGWPMAVTEAHLNCTREEQLRWIGYIWNACCTARREGMDLRAMTAWALFGAYDWDSLLTASKGNYECGAFDVSQGSPRITAVGQMLRRIASGAAADHPLLSTSGWWHHHSPSSGQNSLCVVGEDHHSHDIIRICISRGIPYERLFYGPENALRYMVERKQNLPWAVMLVSSNDRDRKIVSDGCRRLRVPMLDLHDHHGLTYQQLQRLIDLFIDDIFAKLWHPPAAS